MTAPATFHARSEATSIAAQLSTAVPDPTLVAEGLRLLADNSLAHSGLAIALARHARGADFERLVDHVLAHDQSSATSLLPYISPEVAQSVSPTALARWGSSGFLGGTIATSITAAAAHPAPRAGSMRR